MHAGSLQPHMAGHGTGKQLHHVRGTGKNQAALSARGHQSRALMSPQEIKLTGKVSVLVVIITIIVNLTVAFTTIRLYTASMMATMADHEARIRIVEEDLGCSEADISAIRSDQSWMVSEMDRQGRMLEDIQRMLMTGRLQP
jgi:hypothetical protein